MSANKYIHGVKKKWPSFDEKLWQRNYYEHIIRDEQSYLAISECIANNSVRWEKEELYGKENNSLIREILILTAEEGTAANRKKDVNNFLIKRIFVGLKEIYNMRCAQALSAFRAGGWRETKMGDYHGLAGWVEILAFAGR